MRTALTAAAGLLLGLAWGYGSLAFDLPPAGAVRALRTSWAERDPRLHYARREHPAERPAEQRAARLETLGYLGAVQPATRSGVTVYDAAAAYPGPRLLTLGHRAEAQLLTPSGRVLHRWARAFEASFPEKADELGRRLGARLWRRVHALQDGGLLAVHEYLGLVRIDQDSGFVWSRLNGAHHAVEPTGHGTFYALIAEEIGGTLHDFVVEIDPDGRELRRISIERAFKRSAFAPVLAGASGYDPLHANEIVRLDGALAPRLPAFRARNLLLSLRNVSALAVLDPDAARIEWAYAGLFRRQHAPSVVAGGRLLLFDNLGDGGRSRALEFDPATLTVAWRYDNSHGPLFSEVCGSVQRLPNGNTLIAESDAGRVIEVTPERRIVWEYVTPHRRGNRVARVLDAVALETWDGQGP